MYPNVTVDLGALTANYVVPRAGLHQYPRGLIEAAFAKRIMFGSDFPTEVAHGVEVIQTADFLSPEQKRDILCDIAARFLLLPACVCAP